MIKEEEKWESPEICGIASRTDRSCSYAERSWASPQACIPTLPKERPWVGRHETVGIRHSTLCSISLFRSPPLPFLNVRPFVGFSFTRISPAIGRQAVFANDVLVYEGTNLWSPHNFRMLGHLRPRIAPIRLVALC